MHDPRILEFWSWFIEGPARWAPPTDGLDETLELELLDRVAEAFPELRVTFSWTPEEDFELVFSAGLDVQVAARVVAVVEAAPALLHWRIVAFEPPVGLHDLYVAHLGLPEDYLRPEAVHFVVTARQPLDLTLYLPAYVPELEAPFRHAARLLLAAGLGEAFVLTVLHDLALAPRDAAPPSARPLGELQAALDAPA